MTSMKPNLLIFILIFAYTFSISTAIECKICEKSISCIFGEGATTYQCENDDDHCYSWFFRNGNSIGAQRGCLPIASPAYHLIKTIMQQGNSGCAKRIYALDCFTLCSTDLCN